MAKGDDRATSRRAWPSVLRLAASDVALMEAYTAGLLVYSAVRPFVSPGRGWWELIEDFAPWWYAPVPLLVGAGVRVRSPMLVAGGLVAASAFLARWGRLLATRPTASAQGGTLKMMSYNVLAWSDTHERIADSVLAEGPDVVAFQELSPDAADYLADAIGSQYPHSVAQTVPDPSGVGIFSRYPLREAVGLQLSKDSHWSQRVVVEAPEGPFTLFNVHASIPRPQPVCRGRWRLLDFRSDRRAGEIRRLASMIDAEVDPVLAVGDFNMTEWSVDYRVMRSRLGDAFRAAGRGFGFTFPNVGHLPRLMPVPWPALRIDYIWHSAQFIPVEAHLGRPGGSDHRPVIVSFARAPSTPGRGAASACGRGVGVRGPLPGAGSSCRPRPRSKDRRSGHTEGDSPAPPGPRSARRRG